MPTTSLFTNTKRGPLLVIGGAEESVDLDRAVVLRRLVAMAGGKKARLLISAASTTHPQETLEGYKAVFEKLGVAEVMGFAMETRDEANAPEAVEALDRATGVFFTGGDQLRLTAVVAGTEFGARLQERYQSGLFVAGTSAGAAAVAGTMITGGQGGIVCRECIDLAPGLGLWAETVVDTHFDRSGRVHRLMAAIVQNPGVLGIGINEDTAVEVSPKGQMTVVGSGNVFVFDGRIRHSNAADVAGDEPISMTYSTLHVLGAGYGMDLVAMEPTLPAPAKELADDERPD
jgi:cyanophycinase